MDDPHILDILLDRLDTARSARAEPHISPRKSKGGKKRSVSSGRTRTKSEDRDISMGQAVSPIVAVLSDDTLRRDMAHATIRSVAAYSLDQTQDLIEQSASFIEALLRLWALRGIDANAVWREIDHRVQLGNLLNQINRDMPIDRDTTRKYWRPSSTKLP